MTNRILCFSLNTDQTPLCETYLNYKTTDKITKSRGYFSKNSACFNPLFFDDIAKQIIKYNPEIAVFFTENDLVSGSWFHSDFLIEQMKQIVDTKGAGYKLLSRDKYSGPDIYNGTREETAIRMSIFIKESDDTTKNVEMKKTFFSNDDNKMYCNAKHEKQKKSYEENVRALALYTQNKIGKIAFIGIQYNENSVNDNRICLEEIENKFLKDKKVDHVFIMGDYANNYEEEVYNVAYPPSNDKIDEKRAMEFLVSGPNLNDFRKKSIPKNYNNGNYGKKEELPSNSFANYYEKHENDYRTNYDSTYKKGNLVGYHDRILNKDLGDKIQCLEYQVIKGFPIHTQPNSYHYGVLGVYQV